MQWYQISHQVTEVNALVKTGLFKAHELWHPSIRTNFKETLKHKGRSVQEETKALQSRSHQEPLSVSIEDKNYVYGGRGRSGR